MAKAVAVAGENNDQQNKLTGSWERSVEFFRSVRGEMKKVVTPSTKEVQSTTTIVIITVFVFAAYFYAIDNVLGRGIQAVLHYLGGNTQ